MFDGDRSRVRSTQRKKNRYRQKITPKEAVIDRST
jgi:hypothetical protein